MYYIHTMRQDVRGSEVLDSDNDLIGEEAGPPAR